MRDKIPFAVQPTEEHNREVFKKFIKHMQKCRNAEFPHMALNTSLWNDTSISDTDLIYLYIFIGSEQQRGGLHQ